MSNWRESLEALEIPTTDAAGPGGASGEWHQLIATFGTKGFLRALTDGVSLSLECAPPGDQATARKALDDSGWSIDGESVPFVASRPFPEDIDELHSVWVSVARLADAVRAEDGSAFAAALKVERPEREPEPAAGEEPPASASTGGAFEPIGEDVGPQMQTAFAFAIALHGGDVEVVLGFNEVLERDAYEELERRLRGNLRGKFDVRVDVALAHELTARLDAQARTRVGLRVRPDPPSSDFTLRDAEKAIGSYLETLADLSASGIDPLVFLGARASKRNTGAFESIGSQAQRQTTETEAPTHILVAADDEPAEEEDAVVFAAPPLEPDAPLEAGRHDDERLKRSDATTALVDVVLRHPGYSDRNIGQVMSILLSLDYASCLEIAARAPAIVAWGVARERALTMKTVMEGAGGKVVLVEPGAFGES